MRFVIYGNAASGKTTLARELALRSGIDVLELDRIAYEPGRPDLRRDPATARSLLQAFCTSRPEWIVEGCHGDLVLAALHHRPELVFLNPGPAACLRHARARPWQPHEHPSRQVQDLRLTTLLQAVADYYRRDDEASLRRHRTIFDAYDGPKRELVEPVRLRIANEILPAAPVTGR
jgi:adenylate kinase family enzyme